MKVCSKCKKDKDITEFYKDPRNTLGYDPCCKQCKNNYRKIKGLNKWNPKYNNSGIEYRKKWKENNYSKIKQYIKKHYESNKKEIFKKHLNKKKNNLYFKISQDLRTRFYNLLKKSNTKKNNSILNILGCSLKQYKYHIESMFLPEMNWSNHGIIWEIDHIIPCSKFDLSNIEQQKQCFNYKNQQPLFKTTKIAESFGYKNYIGNRDKSNKIII